MSYGAEYYICSAADSIITRGQHAYAVSAALTVSVTQQFRRNTGLIRSTCCSYLPSTSIVRNCIPRDAHDAHAVWEGNHPRAFRPPQLLQTPTASGLRGLHEPITAR